ncbi:MAG TPA: GerMN domain-containing protein [Acidobacteriaceae bacterium]|nr:GerMN domain-containing protein [Acidobacteriaceae bacterium]
MRYQKLILWLLLVSIVFMAAYLIRMRARAQGQLAAEPNEMPLPVPVEARPVLVTLVLANDANGSLTTGQIKLPLPAETTTRAKAILNGLFAEYATPDSQHMLPAFPAISDVFLLPLPQQTKTKSQPEPYRTGQMAVVNLNGEFANHHPSGIEVETLTLLSMLGTLHANFPQIAQVKFLVDGHQKDTLAGHADLTRTYLAGEDVPPSAEVGPPSQGEPATQSSTAAPR